MVRRLKFLTRLITREVRVSPCQEHAIKLSWHADQGGEGSEEVASCLGMLQAPEDF